MSVAYASHAFTTPALSDTVVITKPSGLAVGDLLIAHIGAMSLGGGTYTLPSGFAFVTGFGNTSPNIICWKIADSGDVAASNFTFQQSLAEVIGGALYRITGGSDTMTASNATYANSGGTSITLAAGITPPASNCLLLFLTATYQTSDNTQTIAGQAIATSNPSWTEDYDAGTTSDVDLWMSGAHASRPEATGTGNLTCTGATTSGTTNGNLIAIAPSVDVTVSPTVISIIASVQSPSISGGATVSPAVVSVTITVQIPTITAGVATVSSVSKHTTSPSNVTKNAATGTNTSKNSSTWTNQTKHSV